MTPPPANPPASASTQGSEAGDAAAPGAVSSATANGRAGAAAVRLGVVGLGERAAWICRCLADVDPQVQLAAVVDPAGEAAIRRVIDERELPTADHLAVYDDLDTLLQRGDELDGLVIGTRCHLHTPLAVRLASLGLPIFLEKPVAITWDQLDALRQAFSGAADPRIVVSFPLSRTPIFEAVRDMVRSGRLGEINQIQAVNNVNYGGVYVEQWYQDCSLTGGLWLQKATHDFDYVHRLAGAEPRFVTAMHSRQVWEEPTLNQDAGSAIVQYHTGVHAAYTQNFLTRRSAGVRGATITGEDATVRFDWNTKSVRVVDHRQERVDEIRIDDEGGHGGGDQRLAANFLDVVRGRGPSLTTLTDGLVSAATCLAARDAAQHRTVEAIPAQSDSAPAEMVQRVIEPVEPAAR